MNDAEKQRLLRTNTAYWLTAMFIPALFDLSFKAFASKPVKFPWVMIVPLLFLGLLLGSNRLLSSAMGSSGDGAGG